MKNKNKNLKIIIIFVSVIVLLIGGFFGYKALINSETGKNNKVEKVNSSITPVLYEVTKEGSNNKIYLFGSIHATKNNELVFSDYIMKAYNDSDYLACEFDIIKYNNDFEKTMNDVMKMKYQDNTTIKDHMKEENYKKMVEFLKEKGVYSELYEVYRPVFFETLISQLAVEEAGLSAEEGVDQYFLKKAKKDKKEILEVESSDFQNNLLISFPDELYELSIADIIDNYEENVSLLKKVYDYWKKGNATGLLELDNEDIDIKDNYTEKQIEYINNYNKRIVDDRNDSMTEKVIEYFNDNKDVFFMVGDFHIIGDTGIAKQLEKKGYTVKQVK